MVSRYLCLLAAAAALSSCTSFNRQQLAQMQARGVSPRLVAKLDRERPVTPPEVIALTRAGVPGPSLERYVDRNGVDYVLTHADARTMRRAGVDVRVIDAIAEESSSFEAGYPAQGRSAVSVGVGVYDPYVYEEPYGYGYGYPFGFRHGHYY